MNDDKLEKELETYRKLAAEDKKIDVASLMISALEKHKGNYIPPGQKRWAYLISIIVPFVGFFFAIKFYLSDKDDATHTAVICVVLTIISLLLTFLFSKALSPSQLFL